MEYDKELPLCVNCVYWMQYEDDPDDGGTCICKVSSKSG